jgi:hypothetical protein
LERPRGLVPRLARVIQISSRLSWKKVLYALALIALMGFSLSGTVAASASSLPGNPLYPVKRWTENVELFFNNDASSRTFRHAELARRRLDEVKALVSYGEDELAFQTVFDYENEINFAVEGLATDQQNRASDAARILREQLIGELAEMQEFQRQVPASSIPVVKHAQMTMTRVIDQLDFPVPSGD